MPCSLRSSPMAAAASLAANPSFLLTFEWTQIILNSLIAVASFLASARFQLNLRKEWYQVRPLSVDRNRMSESVGHWRITVRVRFPRIAFLFACAVSLALPLAAQSTNGTINGRVVDPSNGIITGADILVINDVTGVKYPGKTNDDGIYVVPNLLPGPYRLQVSKLGFKALIKPDIILNVQDALSINFTLPVGAVFETVTVEGGASMINTTDASVSTVIDHTYVENMPLNGRSFQDLILLTPGTETQTPQFSQSASAVS